MIFRLANPVQNDYKNQIIMTKGIAILAHEYKFQIKMRKKGENGPIGRVFAFVINQ
jgi:hypothetical protein